MTHAVQVLAISDDANVCNLIHSALESEGHKAICVPSPMEALQLLHRGVVADFLLFDAARNKSRNALFDPILLQNLRAEKLCILTEMGDTSWESHAAKWNINTILIKPLLRRDLENLTSLPERQAAEPAPLPDCTSTKIPHYHLEELDNNRFFLAARTP